MMTFRYCFVLPIALGVWFPITFVTTYIIAVCNNDVTPAFPYISDTGTWSPESCVFGLMLNIGSILMLIVIYVRYRQVKELCDKNNFKCNVRLYNYISLHLGIMATIGILLVAHFQETNVFSVHILGATLCFGLGVVYLWIQTFVSYQINSILGDRLTILTRFTFSLITTVTFCLAGIFGVLGLLNFQGSDITKWSQKDGGWKYHIISSVSEWIMAISTMFFLTTYTKEFQLIGFKEPEIIPKV